MSLLPRLRDTSRHLEAACVYLSIRASECELQQTLIIKPKVKTVITDVNTKRSSSPAHPTRYLWVIPRSKSSLSLFGQVTQTVSRSHLSGLKQQGLLLSLPASPSSRQTLSLSVLLGVSPITSLLLQAPDLITPLTSFLLTLPVSTSFTRHNGGDSRLSSPPTSSSCQSVPPSPDKSKGVHWWLICWVNTSFFKYSPPPSPPTPF